MKQTVLKVAGVIGVILVAYVVFQVYSSFNDADRVRTEAASLITEYEQLKAMEATYEQQNQVIQAERDRCADYIRQDSGDFSEFEYCKRFINLTATE